MSSDVVVLITFPKSVQWNFASGVGAIKNHRAVAIIGTKGELSGCLLLGGFDPEIHVNLIILLARDNRIFHCHIRTRHGGADTLSGGFLANDQVRAVPLALLIGSRGCGGGQEEGHRNPRDEHWKVVNGLVCYNERCQ